MKLANELLKFAGGAVIFGVVGWCVGLLMGVADNTKSAAESLREIALSLQNIRNTLDATNRE